MNLLEKPRKLSPETLNKIEQDCIDMDYAESSVTRCLLAHIVYLQETIDAFGSQKAKRELR